MFIRLCGLLHDNRNGYSGKENGNMKDFRPLDEQELKKAAELLEG